MSNILIAYVITYDYILNKIHLRQFVTLVVRQLIIERMALEWLWQIFFIRMLAVSSINEDKVELHIRLMTGHIIQSFMYKKIYDKIFMAYN